MSRLDGNYTASNNYHSLSALPRAIPTNIPKAPALSSTDDIEGPAEEHKREESFSKQIPENPENLSKSETAISNFFTLRKPFPDSLLLATAISREDPTWDQKDPAEWAITSYLRSKHVNLTLDNLYIRRKVSYIFMGGAALLCLWGLYKWMNIDGWIERGYFPQGSDAQNKYQLLLVTGLANLTFLAFLGISAATGYSIGYQRDEQFNRRANRNLIPVLTRERYLMAPELAEQDHREYVMNLEALNKHLSDYFKALLSQSGMFQDTCEGVVGAIISVAEYLRVNNIANKIPAPTEEKGAALSPISSLPEPDPNQFSGTLRTRRKKMGLVITNALFTQGVAVHKESGTQASVVVAGHKTRETFRLHESRIQRLEDLMAQRSTNQYSHITPEFVNLFPLILMLEFKRLLTVTGLKAPARHRARALSALISDTFLQDHPELQKTLILAYFAPIPSNSNDKEEVIEKGLRAAEQDTETFSALPSAHQEFIQELVFENPPLKALCLSDKKNDSQSLKATIYTELSKSLTGTWIFCNLNPELAGILLSRFFCASNDLNPDHLSFAWQVIWSPMISDFSREKLILTIEKHSLLSTTHIFGHNKAHEQDPSTLESIKWVKGHRLLAKIIEDKYLRKIKEGLSIIADLEKTHQEQLDEKKCASLLQIFRHKAPKEDQVGYLGRRENDVNLLKHLLKKLTQQLIDISPDNETTTQHTLLKIVECVPDIEKEMRDAIFLKLFRSTQFPFRYSHRLMPLCEKHGIPALFDRLLDDEDASLSHRMALVLIHAFYEKRISFKIGSVFSRCHSKPLQEPREKINEVLQAANIATCSDIDSKVLKGLGVSPQWIKKVEDYRTAEINVSDDVARRVSQVLKESDRLIDPSDSENGYGAMNNV